MQVRLRVPAALRDVGGGRPSLTFELREDATVAELLDAVAVAHPALGRRIRDEQGALRVHVNLFVGADDVRALDGALTVLRAGDEISVMAAISGG